MERGDGKRLVVRSDEALIAFIKLKAAVADGVRALASVRQSHAGQTSKPHALEDFL
jgi:hypothetical protein